MKTIFHTTVQHWGLSKRKSWNTLKPLPPTPSPLVPNPLIKKKKKHSYFSVMSYFCNTASCWDRNNFYADVFSIFMIALEQLKQLTVCFHYVRDKDLDSRDMYRYKQREAPFFSTTSSINQFVTWVKDFFHESLWTVTDGHVSVQGWVMPDGEDVLVEMGSFSMDRWRSKEPSGSQHGPCMKKNVLARTGSQSSPVT